MFGICHVTCLENIKVVAPTQSMEKFAPGLEESGEIWRKIVDAEKDLNMQ